MSGGYFSYDQYRIQYIAEMIDDILEHNTYEYSQETIAKFKETADTLYRAATMVQRVDWLLSGDDGEESFHTRWKEEGLG